MSRLVSEKVSQLKYSDKAEEAYLQISQGFGSINDTITKTRRLRGLFVPAILYWQWNKALECEVDAARLANIFARDLRGFADSLSLSKNSGFRKFEVELTTLPHKFVYTNQGYVAILIVAYVTSQEELMTVVPGNAVVKFRVLEGEKVIAEQELQMRMPATEPEINRYMTTRKYVHRSVVAYYGQLQQLARLTALRLHELQN